ncbi:MAG: hypothetical protein IJ773_14780 [Lachnospiraceae bacterium]|nr:hypothetical protein [Lachnospiraceae bacterium]
MKKNRWTAAMLAAGLCLGMLSGCSESLAGKTPADYPGIAAGTMGNETISLAEVNYYLRNTQEFYEIIYNGYYGDQLWTMQYSDTASYGEYIRQMMVNTAYQIHVLNNHAEELGISLSDADKAKCAEAVKSWLSTSDEALVKAVGLGEEELIKIYEQNALANKVAEALIADTDRVVSDEEARTCRVTLTTLSGASQLYDAETIKDEILRRIEGGQTLREVLLTYPDYNLTSSDYTVSSTDYTTTFGPTAMGLTTGQTEAVYVESVNNWYVMTCVTDTDQAATASTKTSIIQERENAKFTEKYTVYRDAAPEFVPNQDAIELLTFDQFLYVPETTQAAAVPAATEGEETVAGSEAAEEGSETAETGNEAAEEETTAAAAETESEAK